MGLTLVMAPTLGPGTGRPDVARPHNRAGDGVARPHGARVALLGAVAPLPGFALVGQAGVRASTIPGRGFVAVGAMPMPSTRA